MNNVMLDLETWGTEPGCALRSVGAVLFDPYGDEIGSDTFYANISDASCEAAGLIRSAGTIAWWKQQSQQAQDSLVANQLTLTEVGVAFNDWFRRVKGVFVWSQGANFDEPLWCAAMRAVGRPVPWKFYDVRDTRTAYDLAKLDTRKIKRRGTYHNALDDARHQAVCVQTAYRKIEGRLT